MNQIRRNGRGLISVVRTREFLNSGSALIARRAVVHRFLLFTLSLLIGTGSVALADQFGEFTYERINGDTEIEITNYPESAVGSVDIPSEIVGLPVTSIAGRAFNYCSGLTSVSIPDSVTNIGAEAFYYCSELSSATIPDSVSGIGFSAFALCTNMTSVTIGSGVTTMGGGVFTSCINLTTIAVDPSNSAYISVDDVLFNKAQTTLIKYPEKKAGDYSVPNSVTAIEIGAFSGCTALTSLAIPDSVTSGIGFITFYHCTSLVNFTVDSNNPVVSSQDGVLFNKDKTTLMQFPSGKAGTYTIPGSVTTVGQSAFSFCSHLTSVTIPNSVTSIGFQQCSSLTSITVDSNNPSLSSLDGVLFNKDRTALIQFPAGKAGSYTIPDSVIHIWDRAFESCTGLTSVAIPDSVLTIGDYAFASCTSLTSVTIPDSVTSIRFGAFYGSTSLTGIYFEGDAPSVSGSLFWGGDLMTVYYLAGTTGWDTEYGGLPTALWVPSLGAVAITADRFGFTITGPTDQVVVVEACTDLAANPRLWVEVETLTLTGGSAVFADVEPPTLSACFYRVTAQ